MKTKLKLAAYAATLTFAGGLLAACGGGGSSSPKPPNPPPPPPSAVSFTSYVHQTLKLSAFTKPREINGVKFNFTDLNNPKAYCDVLPAATTGPCAGGG